MPLVICRACKSYAGKAINYITDKKKAERITTHGLDETRSLAQQFIDTAAIHGKGDTYDERKYYHIKISFEPKDRIENGGKLDAELAEKIADEYFQKQYGNYEYVLAIHTDKNHIHCHAIINAVSFETGRKIQHRNKDLMVMKNEVNDVAEKYGVSRFDWKAAVKTKRQKAKEERADAPKELTQGEKYIMERRGEEWTSGSWKEVLRTKIDEAKNQCTNRADFEKYLFDNYEIEMPRNTLKTVSFKHPAVDETVRGVKLGANYTAESIDRALIQNQERSVNNANKLQPTEERAIHDTHTSRNDHTATGTAKFNNRDSNTATKSSRSGTDESGERRIETNTGELFTKLHEIRGLDKQFNPAEQRRADEAAERVTRQSKAEAERLENEQRRIKRKHNSHDR